MPHDGADLAHTSRLKIKPYLRIIRTMCSRRVDPSFILRAFSSGADGVMIAGYHLGDRHYLSGDYEAWRQVGLLKKTLPQLGNEFIDKITALGPLSGTQVGVN